MNPQAAVDIVQGHGRVRSFLEQIQPGQGRQMPVVAGIQREGNTPMAALPMIAGASPVMPRTVMPTMPQAQAAGVNLNGLRDGTAPPAVVPAQPSTWPMWLKVLLPIVIVGGVGAAAWGIHRHMKRRSNNLWPDMD